MREPEHPVSTAFETARDAENAWWRQKIAALTAQQRRGYERLRVLEKRRYEARKNAILAQVPQRVREEKRRRLLSEAKPVLQPFPARRMKEWMAKKLAKAVVKRLSSQEIRQARADALGNLAEFLREAERERKRAAWKENARDMTQARVRGPFNKAAGGSDQRAHRGQSDRSDGQAAPARDGLDLSWNRANKPHDANEAVRRKGGGRKRKRY